MNLFHRITIISHSSHFTSAPLSDYYYYYHPVKREKCLYLSYIAFEEKKRKKLEAGDFVLIPAAEIDLVDS